ncbi:ferredoxin [Candidatus Woesearchaeota archaeon CG10_big_fil_rev_8_21_14_0_10_45_16]|nr:MAG: ferredoxin [Candidatus Woesearchaeota archaeon CG10_big_fil_rev_8_21_14_0_10_45_16]
MVMAKYKVLHFKKDCISCGACAAIAPEYWEMDEEGMADLKGSKKVDDHYELDIDSEEAKAINQEAADVCPVNIIHVKEKKS